MKPPPNGDQDFSVPKELAKAHVAVRKSFDKKTPVAGAADLAVQAGSLARKLRIRHRRAQMSKAGSKCISQVVETMYLCQIGAKSVSSLRLVLYRYERFITVKSRPHK